MTVTEAERLNLREGLGDMPDEGAVNTLMDSLPPMEWHEPDWHEPATEGAPDGQAPSGDVRHKPIVLWAEAAVRHAIVRPLEDTDEFVATVAGVRGAWGAGATADEALDELQSVLIDWATLKLDDGDRDIPDMEDIRLVLDA